GVEQNADQEGATERLRCVGVAMTSVVVPVVIVAAVIVSLMTHARNHSTLSHTSSATVISAWSPLFASTLDCRGATAATDWSGGVGMSRRRYIVERAGARWKIRIEDLEHGPYESQLEAITAAIAAAQRAGADEAMATEVLVQRLDPTYRIVWTFG